MLVEERKLFQKHLKLDFVDCFKDVPVVGAEEKELTASAASPAPIFAGLVKLLAVFDQIEAVLDSWDFVLFEQPLENLWWVDGASAVKERKSRQDHGLLLEVSKPFGVYSKGDLFFVIDILDWF